MIPAGQLDSRITIQRVAESRDPDGGVKESWQVLADVWARHVRGSGAESFQPEQRLAEQRVVFDIRWRADVTPKMRVLWRGQVWDIEDVAPLGRNDFLRLTCRGLDIAAKGE